jgi:hypothetical protein
MIEKFVKSEEVEMIRLKDVEFSKEFFDMLEKAKKEVAAKRGYDVDYGQYIEQMTLDFIFIIDSLSKGLDEAGKPAKIENPMFG